MLDMQMSSISFYLLLSPSIFFYLLLSSSTFFYIYSFIFSLSHQGESGGFLFPSLGGVRGGSFPLYRQKREGVGVV